MKLVRVEPGWYRTDDGAFEMWKADDGIPSHGGPVWIVWRMHGGARARIDVGPSFKEAKEKLLAHASKGDVGAFVRCRACWHLHAQKCEVLVGREGVCGCPERVGE